jgi:hypothetical protein
MVIVDEDMNGIVVRRGGYVSTNPGFAIHNGPGVAPWRKVASGFGTWVNEHWRIYCGGGIAGNGDQWWMRRLGDGPMPSGPLGPFTSQRALTVALRQWRDFKIP